MGLVAVLLQPWGLWVPCSRFWRSLAESSILEVQGYEHFPAH